MLDQTKHRDGVEIVPLHVMEDVKTSMQRIGDERYEQYNHIPFECAALLPLKSLRSNKSNIHRIRTKKGTYRKL